MPPKEDRQENDPAAHLPALAAEGFTQERDG